MKARVVVRRAAELDLAAIEDWYDGEEPGSAPSFGTRSTTSSPASGRTRSRIPSGTEETGERFCGGSPMSCGIDSSEILLLSWRAFMECVIPVWLVPGFVRVHSYS